MKLGFWFKFFVGTFLFILITALSGWLTLYILTRSGDIVIPELIGQDLVDAMVTLQKKKIQAVVVDKKFHQSIPSGYIIAQNPNAGVVRAEYSTISLIVSKGPEKISMPDLGGFSLRQANIEAEKFGFKRITTKFIHHSEFEESEIISHIPASGETVFSGENIQFLVSLGDYPICYRMKDYIGKSIGNVKSEIENEFNLNIRYSRDDTFKSGIIINQSPHQGEPVFKNQDVLLTVIENSNNSPADRLFSYTVPKGLIDRKMTIIIMQGDEKIVFREETVKPSQKIRMFIPIKNTQKIEVYLDNRLVYEETI